MPEIVRTGEEPEQSEENQSLLPEQSLTIPDQEAAVGTSNNQPTIPPEYFALLSERDTEINNLKQQLNSQRTQVQTPTTEESNQLYYTDPDKYFETKISTVLEDRIRPLTEFVRKQQKEITINNLMTTLASHPNYAKFFNNTQFRMLVQSNLMQLPEVNEQTATLLINNAVALALTGQIPGVSFSNDVPPTTMTKTAPYVAPSASAMPVAQPKVARQLTETERRFARAANMTDAEYLEALEGGFNDYATKRVK